MLSRVLSLLMLLATATAFAPQTAFVAKTSATALSAVDFSAIPAIMSSTAAVATEGTNEWFGVDDTRLLGVLFIVHWGILSLWLQQYGDSVTDTESDFFGEIDYTGK